MNIFQRAVQQVTKALWYDLEGRSFGTWINGKFRKKSTYELLEEYKNLVYACVTAIAQDVAMYEPIFYTKDDQDKIKPINHPFKKVLESPNPTMSQFELFEASQSYIEVAGEVFWYFAIGERTLKPREVYIMSPDKVEVSIDDITGEVTGYVFQQPNGVKIPLELNEVIHFKTFNPLNPYRGLSTISAGQIYVDTENSTTEFQYNYIKNQASPSGVLTLDGTIKNDAFLKIKQQWQEQHGGSGNAGKTLIIRGAEAKFTKMGLSLGDLDMEALKRITEDKVYKIFRIPKAILGDTDQTGLGRANIEAAEYIFAKRVIDPKQIRLDDGIRLFINKVYTDQNVSIYVGHKSQIPQDAAAELNENDKAVDRWKTRNEIRKEKGLEPIEGGDILYHNSMNVPIDESDTASDPALPVKGIRLRVIRKHRHVEEGEIEKEEPVTKGLNMAAFIRELERIELRNSKLYKGGLGNLLDEQKQMVLDLLPKVKRFKSLEKQVVNLEGALFAMTFSDQDIRLNLLESLIIALFNSGTRALELIGKPDDEFIIDQATRNSIFDSTKRLTKSFNEETALKLQQQLSQGLEAGETREQLTARVESIYEEAKGFRAERIARTEAHSAVNEGTAIGYKFAGITQMRWRTKDGACELCLAMEGSITEIGTPFVKQGQTVIGTDGSEFVADYKDIEFADLHPNCDCYLEPIIN